MSILLADALRELALQPGESRCVTVDGYEVVVRRPASHEEGPMAQIFLKVPPSPKAVTFVVQERTRILPDPIVITEDDLTPGNLGSEDGWFTS
jgi:hypothetical protein